MTRDLAAGEEVVPALNDVLLVPEDAVSAARGRDGTEGESRIAWHERESLMTECTG